jgi:hypothetical protein
MIFSVFYNVPGEIIAYRIESYDITEPELYIPKFLLLKMADFCNKKSKYMLKNDEKIILDYLIQGFRHVGIISNDMDESYIWKEVDKYLLLADVNRMTELYNDMTRKNDDGYAAFSVLEEVD